jgi:phosphotransacetylase
LDLKQKLSKIIVFGKYEEFSKEFFAPNCTIIDINNFEKLDDYAYQLYELRKHKGLTLKQAKELVKSPEYFSMLLLKNNGIVNRQFHCMLIHLRR